MISSTLARPARALALALTVLFAACGGGRSEIDAPGPVEHPLAAAAATITPADMLDRIGYLASDELRGRDTPSPGLELAAQYLVNEFMRMGLEPGAENGEYVQRYPFPLVGVDSAAVSLGIAGAEPVPTLAYGEDFLVLAGETEALAGPLVFVGAAQAFAESAPAATALAGRLPVAYLPGALSREWQATIGRAREAAEAAGVGVLVIALASDFGDAQFAQLRGFMAAPRRVLGELTGTTVVLLRHAAAQSLVEAAGTTLEDALAEAAAAPVALGELAADFAAPVVVASDDEAPNVIAILRGSDPELRDEFVVFSAHMDHVGVGRPDATGDSIYNGADDDASGTSALVEVAQAFSNLLQRPRRSLMFLAVSGEEKGLLGSRWFSEHPTVPLEDMVANINVDMIGRNAPDTIVVIGQEYSSLGPTVHQVAAARPELGLTVSEDIWPEERFFFRSDHFNFARKEIPALFFFAGVHEDYHRPSDEVELIDEDKAARVARLIFYTAHAIADAPAAPVWTEEGLEEIRALTAGGR